jgi:hypothetical protein
MSVIELERDPLPDAPQSPHPVSNDGRHRWLNRSQQKRTAKPHILERLPHHTGFKRRDVGRNVRQFRHAHQLARSLSPFATSVPMLEPPLGMFESVQQPLATNCKNASQTTRIHVSNGVNSKRLSRFGTPRRALEPAQHLRATV